MGLCRACYREDRKARGVLTIHPAGAPTCGHDLPIHAKGLCAACYRRARGVRQKAPDAVQTRRHNLVKHYGLTPAEYDAMLAEQGGVCAICRQPETQRGPNGEVRPLSVDHDHATGEICGLCCSRCNTGLGWFRDDPALMAEALAYLLRTRVAHEGARTVKPLLRRRSG